MNNKQCINGFHQIFTTSNVAGYKTAYEKLNIVNADWNDASKRLLQTINFYLYLPSIVFTMTASESNYWPA